MYCCVDFVDLRGAERGAGLRVRRPSSVKLILKARIARSDTKAQQLSA